jgi:hypothetical protein
MVDRVGPEFGPIGVPKSNFRHGESSTPSAGRIFLYARRWPTDDGHLITGGKAADLGEQVCYTVLPPRRSPDTTPHRLSADVQGRMKEFFGGAGRTSSEMQVRGPLPQN